MTKAAIINPVTSTAVCCVLLAVLSCHGSDAEYSGRLRDPEGLAVDELGNIYVANEQGHNVLVMNRQGETIRSFEFVDGYVSKKGKQQKICAGDSLVVVEPMHVVMIAQHDLAELDLRGDAPRLVRVIGTRFGSGPGAFEDPEGIARDPANGDLYVTDEDNHRIEVFDRDGNYLREWPVPDDCESICLFEDRVYVTFSKADWVGCYSKDGTLRFRFGETGSGRGEFEVPEFVAVSPRRLLYVTDQENHRIQVFQLDGRFCFEIGKFGSAWGEFSTPEDLAFDPLGNLVVADSDNHRIQILTWDGRPLRVIE